MGNSQAAPEKEEPADVDPDDNVVKENYNTEVGNRAGGGGARYYEVEENPNLEDPSPQKMRYETDRSTAASTPNGASPMWPSILGRQVGKSPLDSGPIEDPSFAMDSPSRLRMPPGSEVVAGGTALPSDAHGYSGERDELGQRHGDGVQLFPDGRRYSGQFDANTFHGAGIMEWPDGHRYTGQYENNHKSGEGFFLWPDGRFYDGQWRMGQRHGYGQYIAAESYVGDYCEGFRHGDGVLSWPDGKRYAGQFFRGGLHGSAVMNWTDGRRYIGQYMDNQKQGDGLFYWPDGRLYEGQWRKGLRHGTSRFIDNSGEEQEGTWHKDRLVKSNQVSEPGIQDPYCAAPEGYFGKKSNLKEKLESIDEQQDAMQQETEKDAAARQAGAGALTQEDVSIDIAQVEELSAREKEARETEEERKRREGVVVVNGTEHELLELGELREMSHSHLRHHANLLHSSFGHVSNAVPQHDHGLLGWIYEVQSRHLRPMLDGVQKAELAFEHSVEHGAVKAAQSVEHHAVGAYHAADHAAHVGAHAARHSAGVLAHDAQIVGAALARGQDREYDAEDDTRLWDAIGRARGDAPTGGGEDPAGQASRASELMGKELQEASDMLRESRESGDEDPGQYEEQGLAFDDSKDLEAKMWQDDPQERPQPQAQAKAAHRRRERPARPMSDAHEEK